MRRLTAIALALTLLAAAAGWWAKMHKGPEPPVPGDLSQADQDVVELIERSRAAVLGRLGDDGLRRQLGRVYEANGFFDAARECYEQVVESSESDGRAWYRLAICRERIGDFAGAVEAMRRSIACSESYAPASIRLAHWLVDAGELEEAQVAVDRAASLAPAARGHQVAQARIHMEGGEPQRAIALITSQGLTEGPTAAYAAHLLATAHRMSGDPAAASEALDAVGGAAVRSGPGIDDPWTRELEGLRAGLAAKQRQVSSLLRAGRYAQAIELLKPLVGKHPDEVRLQVMLAQCYMATGRSEDALRAAGAAVSRQPDHFGSNLAFAQVSLALASRGADLEQASQCVDRAVELRPGDGQAWRIRAELWFAKGRVEEALGGWREAWSRDARDPAPLLRAGYVQLELARWEDARKTFEEILEAFESHALALLGRARSEMELGELEAATRSLDGVVGVEAANQPVLDATRVRLNQLRGQ